MDYITVTAKTLDDAITDALVELGVTSDKLDYVVIEKGSAGFLGIGMKQAVIKARRKEEPKAENEVAFENTSEEKEDKKELRKEKKFDHKNDRKYDKKCDKKFERKAEKKFEKKSEKPGGRKDEVKEEKQERQETIKETHEIKLVPVEEETLSACKKFVEDVLAAMGIEGVTVTAEVDQEGALSINMDGSNMGILIGKRGQTLDSLQYLTNRVANKVQDGYVRVKLDTEDYRRRRKQTLENLAKNIAGKVKRTRRTVSLEPMNPYERRIIHSALQSDPAVSTHSEGEEPYRRVVVTLVRK